VRNLIPFTVLWDPPSLALSQCHVPRHHLATARSLRLGTSCRHHFVELIPLGLTLSNANWKHFYLPMLFCFLAFFSSCLFLGHLVVFRGLTSSYPDFLIWFDLSRWGRVRTKMQPISAGWPAQRILTANAFIYLRTVCQQSWRHNSITCNIVALFLIWWQPESNETMKQQVIVIFFSIIIISNVIKKVW